MSGSGPVSDDPDGPERMEELFGNAFDLASQIAPQVSPGEADARLRRTLEEASQHPEGTLAGQAGHVPGRRGASAGRGLHRKARYRARHHRHAPLPARP